MPEDVLEQTPEPTQEAPQETAPPQDEVVASPETAPEQPTAEEPHALEPGGERFKEVWARAKRTEDRLAREREERIRLEERLRVKEDAEKAKLTSQERVYTWNELEEAITAGKITRGDAQEYREKVLRQQFEREADAKVNAAVNQQLTLTRVASDIESYKSALPSVNEPGSAEHNLVVAEYQDIIETYGAPKDRLTELKYQRDALKRAFGLVDRLRKPVATPKPKVDSVQDTTTDARPTNTSKSKDVLTTLTPSQKAHYEKMITRGVYEGWGDVREELNWTRNPKKKQ